MTNILKGLKIWWHIRRIGDLTLQIRRCNRAISYFADEEVGDDSRELISIQKESEVLYDKRKRHYRKLCGLDPIPTERRQAC